MYPDFALLPNAELLGMAVDGTRSRLQMVSGAERQYNPVRDTLYRSCGPPDKQVQGEEEQNKAAGCKSPTDSGMVLSLS